MKVFYVSYDIDKNEKETYDLLVGELKRIKSKNILESVWSIETSDDDKFNSKNILEHLKKIIKNKDRCDKNVRILVIEALGHDFCNPIKRPYSIQSI
jgi:hypothetical protein